MNLTLTFEISTKNNHQPIKKKICKVLSRHEEFLFQRSLNRPMGNASAKVSKGGASLTTMCQVSVYHLASSLFFLTDILSHSRCLLTSLKSPSDSL